MILGIFATLLACSSPPQEGYTEQSNLYVVFETNPSPIPFKEFFDVRVGVYENDKQETLLKNVSILVDANMPEHNHGMNVVPEHTVDTDGYTVASGLEWFMTGTWELEFYITPEEGPVETAFFSIECCEQ